MISNFKQRKIQPFHQLYYSNTPHKKIDKLPFWIYSYAYWLDKEVNHKLPDFYRSFAQGTIVMIDFGVRLGSEMSNGHFGVVLNTKDNKYQRNIIVIPLTSKNKKQYVPLENEVFVKTKELVNEKLKEVKDKQKKLKYETGTLEDRVKEVETVPNDVIVEVSSQNQKFQDTFSQLNFSSSDIDSTNKLIQTLEQQISISELPNLLRYLAVLKSLIIRLSNLEKDYKGLSNQLDSLGGLVNHLTKYNKETYADVSSITTVSKLRVQKFSSYDISSNIFLDSSSIDKIKARLYKIL